MTTILHKLVNEGEGGQKSFERSLWMPPYESNHPCAIPTELYYFESDADNKYF